jgi:hypothetical protein
LADQIVEKKSRLDQTTKDMEDDPFVKSLKSDFGGTLVSESIRPSK